MLVLLTKISFRKDGKGAPARCLLYLGSRTARTTEWLLIKFAIKIRNVNLRDISDTRNSILN